MRISRRASRVSASGIRRMFDLGAQLANPIDLSIGQPDFDVPEPIKEAAIAAIRAGRNKYTVTQGLSELNERVLHRVHERTGVRPEASLMTTGVAGGLTLGLMALLDPNERALIPDPYFVCYRNLASMLAQDPAYYDTYPDFRITDAALEAGMDENVRVLIINTPANPTGRVLDGKELAIVARFAKRHDLVVLTDEIYDLFTFDGPLKSILSYYDQVLLLGGFSKTFGMPGWRQGYAVGPKDVIDRMRTLQQFSFVCAPTPFQHALLASFDIDMSHHVVAYRKKRDLLYEGLKDVFDLVRPEGAFYAFPRAPGGSADAFAERALARNLLLVPGQAFSRRNTHVRLSFALADDVLERGIEILRDLAMTEEQGGHGAG